MRFLQSALFFLEPCKRRFFLRVLISRGAEGAAARYAFFGRRRRPTCGRRRRLKGKSGRETSKNDVGEALPSAGGSAPGPPLGYLVKGARAQLGRRKSRFLLFFRCFSAFCALFRPGFSQIFRRAGGPATAAGRRPAPGRAKKRTFLALRTVRTNFLRGAMGSRSGKKSGLKGWI